MMKLDFAVGRTILKIYIFVVGRWKRRSVGILMIEYGRLKTKTRKGRKKKRKTKRTVTILERRARRRASSSPAERMW